RRPIDFGCNISVDQTFNGIISDLFLDTHIFNGAIDALHEEIFFIGLRKHTARTIPRQFLCGGCPTGTIETPKALRLEANKHLTPTDWQMLEHDPVIQTIKGVDTPLTYMAGGMVERTFHGDD